MRYGYRYRTRRRRFRHHWLALPWLWLAAALLTVSASNQLVPIGHAVPAQPVSAREARDLARHFAATLSRQEGIPLDRLGAVSLQAVARDEGGIARKLPAYSTATDRDFNWKLSVVYHDELGIDQPLYVPGFTAESKNTARVEGDVTTADHQASVKVSRFLDVQGFKPSQNELRFHGSSNDSASCTFAAGDGAPARRYDLASVGSLEDMRQLKDASVNPYPLSGTLRWHVAFRSYESTPRGESKERHEAAVVVSFNGTRRPTLEVDKRWRFAMDLETGEIAPLASPPAPKLAKVRHPFLHFVWPISSGGRG